MDQDVHPLRRAHGFLLHRPNVRGRGASLRFRLLTPSPLSLCSIHEYARDVWYLDAFPRPAPEHRAGSLRRARSNPSLNAYVSPSSTKVRGANMGLSNLSEVVRGRAGCPAPPYLPFS